MTMVTYLDASAAKPDRALFFSSAADDHRLLGCAGTSSVGPLARDELPKYLLAPEVSALLHSIPVLYRKAQVATLWNSGARVKEALALSRTDFFDAASLSVGEAGHAQKTEREQQAVCLAAVRFTV